jgi:hypothetical protein
VAIQHEDARTFDNNEILIECVNVFSGHSVVTAD